MVSGFQRQTVAFWPPYSTVSGLNRHLGTFRRLKRANVFFRDPILTLRWLRSSSPVSRLSYLGKPLDPSHRLPHLFPVTNLPYYPIKKFFGAACQFSFPFLQFGLGANRWLQTYLWMTVSLPLSNVNSILIFFSSFRHVQIPSPSLYSWSWVW